MHLVIPYVSQLFIQRCKDVEGVMFGGKAAGLRVYRKGEAVGAAET